MTASKEPFTIQAGKRYNRRDRKISGVIEVNTGYHDFRDGVYYYHKDGRGNGLLNEILISEYIEPTAEPQDEWGPWVVSKSGEKLPKGEYDGKVEFVDGVPRVWVRIKKEPEVREMHCYINQEKKTCLSYHHSGARRVIITITNGEPSIRWADKGETK